MLVYSHNPHSQGAKALSKALGCKRIKHNNSRFTGRRRPLVVNWGSSDLPAWADKVRLLNDPRAVERVSNKLTFFRTMDGLGVTPLWTDNEEIVEDWLKDGHMVVARTILKGSGGKGIVLLNSPDNIVKAPLYVRYVPKKSEYRVHIFSGFPIDYQRKARAHDVPDDQVNWQIRNHANGFIYARKDIDVPECVTKKAVTCINNTGLHFGAVDVIYNEKENGAYVLEVNTAPGLEGQTVDGYVKAIREYEKSIR